MTKLNDMDGKEWVKNTKSWFILRGKSRGKEVINHPAKFPEELAEKYIEFFTKSGEMVFDPFMGVGSTAVASKKLKRDCYGIEINMDFCTVANQRIKEDKVVLGDSRKFKNFKIDKVDFIITSPPYWDILKKQRGHSDSQHMQRKDKNLKLYYSDDPNDLGNIEDYDCFLRELRKVFKNCLSCRSCGIREKSRDSDHKTESLLQVVQTVFSAGRGNCRLTAVIFPPYLRPWLPSCSQL